MAWEDVQAFEMSPHVARAAVPTSSTAWRNPSRLGSQAGLETVRRPGSQ